MNGNNTTLRVFVGWDSREDIAFQACKQSLLTAAKYPNNLEIYPLKLDELRKKGVYTREEDKLGSTEFTFSRFLVPALCDYEGWALFIDCFSSSMSFLISSILLCIKSNSFLSAAFTKSLQSYLIINSVYINYLSISK